MSKSRGNIVSPDKIIEKYGADTLRLFILFIAPPQKQLEWSIEGVEGCWRFVHRVWRLQDLINAKSESEASQKDKDELLKIMHQTIKKVSFDIEKKLQFNTAVSAIMELVNALYAYKFHSNDGGVSKEVYKTVILLMAPFTPHLCEEIWHNMGNKNYISLAAFPSYDLDKIKEDSIEIPVQINGKIRGKIIINDGASQEAVKQIIDFDEKIQKNLEGKTVVKFIYVQNKIATLVVK
jgi:leucyl-tRNA synthetase